VSGSSSNQLKKVTDATANTSGFADGANATTEYTYTTHGSLTADQNKGISSITYNDLGKPSQIVYNSGPNNGTTLYYTYDAAGTKLKVITSVSGSNSTTDYVDGYVYTNSSLTFFSSPEGRVVKNGSNYEYQYSIADHQGNTRVVFTSATPVASSPTATFEGDAGDQSAQFTNVTAIPFTSSVSKCHIWRK
jgi:hypothetical protein